MKQLVCNQQTGRPCWAGGMWVIRRVYCVSELGERERDRAREECADCGWHLDDWCALRRLKLSLGYTHAESTSDVVEGTYGHRTERLIYGVFTTPENSIYGSAICAFRLQDVMDSFDGAFKVTAENDTLRPPTLVGHISFTHSLSIVFFFLFSLFVSFLQFSPHWTNKQTNRNKIQWMLIGCPWVAMTFPSPGRASASTTRAPSPKWRSTSSSLTRWWMNLCQPFTDYLSSLTLHSSNNNQIQISSSSIII